MSTLTSGFGTEGVPRKKVLPKDEGQFLSQVSVLHYFYEVRGNS